MKALKRIKRIIKRVKYKIGFTGWSWCYGASDGCESWKVFKLAGCPQETYGTESEHDCSGKPFCSSVRSYCFGVITIGSYGIDV